MLSEWCFGAMNRRGNGILYLLRTGISIFNYLFRVGARGELSEYTLMCLCVSLFVCMCWRRIASINVWPDQTCKHLVERNGSNDIFNAVCILCDAHMHCSALQWVVQYTYVTSICLYIVQLWKQMCDVPVDMDDFATCKIIMDSMTDILRFIKRSMIIVLSIHIN